MAVCIKVKTGNIIKKKPLQQAQKTQGFQSREVHHDEDEANPCFGGVFELIFQILSGKLSHRVTEYLDRLAAGMSTRENPAKHRVKPGRSFCFYRQLAWNPYDIRHVPILKGIF